MSLASQQSTLERFRRVARSHHVPEAPNELEKAEEIEWLRSHLNGKIYRNAENWMVPTWVLGSRRSGMASSDEDSLANDQRRNWITLGGVGSHEYAICDSKGLLTAIPECGSIDFWLLGPTGVVYPSAIPEEGTRLVLPLAEDQVYELKMDLGPVEFSRVIYHSSEEGNETIYNEVQVRSRSLERAKLTFYAVIRPMSVKGVEPIEVAEYSASKKAVYTNGILAMIMNREPKSVYITNADNTGLPSMISAVAPTLDTLSNEPEGLATVVMRFDVLLKPAGTERFFFASPLVPFTKKEPLPTLFMDQRARDLTVQTWFEFMDSTLSGELPDRDLNQVLSQSKAIMAMQIHRSLLAQGTDGSDLPWTEKARLLAALCRCNCLSIAQDVSLEIMRGMQPSTLNDPSAAAPIAWSILQVFEYSQDVSYLREARRFLDQLLPVISEKAQSCLRPALSDVPKEEGQAAQEGELGVNVSGERDQQVGPTPEFGVSHEGELPVAFPESDTVQVVPRLPLRRLSEFVAAAWALQALRSAVGAHDRLGDTEQSNSLATLVSDYAAFVKESSDELVGKVSAQAPKAALPEEEVLDAIVLLGTEALLKDRSIGTQLLDRVQSEIAQKWTSISRLAKLPGIARENSIHLTLLLADYYAFSKDRTEAAALLRGVSKFLSAYHVLPDWVDPKAGGGCRGSGCSSIAAADLLLLLRDMIVSEDGEDLAILPGIPQDWHTSNNALVLRNTPTPRGVVQIEMGASANQRQIEIRMQSLPREIDAYLPTARTVSMAKVYGGGLAGRFASSASPHLRIVPLSEDVVVAFHR